VLVAVDDAQWLDHASSEALAYGIRRFQTQTIGILLARRVGLESALLAELLRSPARDRFTSVAVGALDVQTLGRVVQEHLGKTLPRPLLSEVHQASGGNPFYALEIVRTLSRSGISVEAGRPLPVPESLQDLVHTRLLALPTESREFLIAAAAHAHPTVAITESASGVGRDVGLEPARAARVVETDGDRLRFTHPLLAAGALEIAVPRRRAEIHARLAELLTDPEARAWQLAASADEPDESIAAALEEAAAHARSRGAPRPAALLLERAVELTPGVDPDTATARAVEAAELHFEAGDSRRAETLLREVVAPLAAGPVRARALVLLARVRLYNAPAEARELFAQVIDEAGDDRRTLALAHEGVAACSLWLFQDFVTAIEHSDVALAMARESGAEALAGDVLMTRLSAEAALGSPNAAATAELALELQQKTTEVRVLDQPLVSVAEYWCWTDLHERSRDALLELLQRAQDHGDENARPWLLYLLGKCELAAGRLTEAARIALEGRQAAEQSAQGLFETANRGLEALAQSALGRAEAAKGAVDWEVTPQGRFIVLDVSAALGHLDLSVGAPGETASRLQPCVDFVRREGIVEPGITRFVVDHVEALIELGRRAEAEELLDWHEGNARRLERASARASCARCRGLLAAHGGDLAAAFAAFEEALEWHAKVELPLDRGRTLLALGVAQRRAKHRREARATLEEALRVFEALDAVLWAERALTELKRISGRAATPGGLTPAEERVAALVAEGKTNREVAAALYLSDRTVEGHLSRVFAKLGIRHRTEVAPALAARQTQGVAPSNTGDSPVSAGPSAP
jgi:DNA-binding CsgD family transcriptional regulator